MTNASPTRKKRIAKKTYNPDKNIRSMVTPEGIDLRLRLADIGARFGAFTIDLVIIIATIIGLVFAFSAIFVQSGGKAGDLFLSIFILLLFFLRNFYFMFFEMGPKGATPGKRIMKIRVADRRGGHLTANAIFARNAMRELEFFLPLGAVFSLGADVNGWLSFLALIWSMVFLLFPVFNRDKLRAGDFIAGTWVVKAPKTKLSKDLSAAQNTQSRFAFTPAQIDAYGVKELHVLENVLRTNNPKTVKEVMERIIKKIEWDDGALDMKEHKIRREFLNAYYAGLRGKLETGLLFGVRRKDKFDKK